MQVEFKPGDSISVLDEGNYILITFPENAALNDIISVVNFQLGYELIRKVI